MKKLIAGLMTLLMMTLSLVIPVFAPTSPCPIALDIMTLTPDMAYGKTIILKDGGVSFFQMKVNVLSEATGYYEWSTDIGHLKPLCGSYEAVILECEEQSTCHKTVSMNMAGYTKWYIDGVDLDVVCPPIPEPVVCDVCDTCDPCPTVTTTTTTTTIPIDEPADYSSEIIVGVIAILFTAVGSVQVVKKYFLYFIKDGWGVRLYKSRDGTKIQVFHKHPGIRNYHDTETAHKDSRYKHGKGVIFG